MDNLGPNGTNPHDPRPYQKGAGQQFDADGNLVNEQKEWLIDTGAEVSAISEENAERFDLPNIVGWAGGAVDDGGGMPIVRGPEDRPFKMWFQRVGRNGLPQNVGCSLPVAIAAFDIIGMDQLSDQNCAIDWDPKTRTGRIYEK